MPISLVCSTCGRSYQLKDEYAGRKVRCPGCQEVQVVPAAPDGDEAHDAWQADDGLHPAFDRDTFLLRQKLMTLHARYDVTDEHDRPVLFVERPAHFWKNIGVAFLAVLVAVGGTLLGLVAGFGIGEAMGNNAVGAVLAVTFLALAIGSGIAMGIGLSPRRHIHFYRDESRSERLLDVLQDRKWAPITATYTVLTPEGQFLGRMEKNYLYNFVRKRWVVKDEEGRRILIAREDSLILSLLRRFLGPMFGMLRTNFVLLAPAPDGQERPLGEFNRKLTIFDRYVLDLTRDRGRTFDRRLAVALGVLLDTGEHR
ncbi:hypothetical protein OJF2_06520 [Aquisphaera giovannonii]|uniref:Uncharacterized protein n=1 Tax=Aquisphaera giovannonii TaxID=406548 RepID=A0A5B9VUX3_9BACT|nr:hypothetical protein [Aquisphaera giovannonii]QEH32183.1 hypothetical protein OJF2_06520 [Aquisphaera giovannonii]